MIRWLGLIAFCVSFISYSGGSLVTWAPNKSFNLPINFDKNTLPCSKSTVVFPESVQETIQIDYSISVKELILPIDGSLVLAEGQSILFGNDQNDANCTEGIIYYKDDSSSAWENPGVWNSSKFNKATPDAERIPCYDDTVLFPKTAQFTVQLPDFTQYVSGIIIDDTNLTTVRFLERITSQPDGAQQFVSGDALNEYPIVVRQEPCKSTSGCPCQTHGLNINCKLKFCPPPKCSNPIKPVGHCCEICGGSLLFEIENFSMFAFKNLVQTIINDFGADEFVYHIGMLPTTDVETTKTMPKRVQVVIMDKGEYTGASSEVANEIGYQMSKEWTKNEKLVLLSGSPNSESGLGSKIAVSMFFVVLATLLALFAYYYRDTKISISELRSSFNMRGGILNRFQERSDSIVSLTRRDSSTSGLREGSGTAFRNPLYDSKRGRVIVTESTLEE
ncbi:unnamed protein product [Chilo suppressalis]|uniref:Protein amnionless n=1 Tax=Chilo suppressalis TaxID=168631 RepID=A0ABN8BFI1_CHISP|nr:unnamed protein product [Chilo suppressalis]